MCVCVRVCVPVCVRVCACACAGEVFHDPLTQAFTYEGALAYCQRAGAALATTAQLYSAWSEGLDRCSPGWLADGSVRYPILAPRERCGGPQAGVKTLYRFANQTGFPEHSALHDVYCFRGQPSPPPWVSAGLKGGAIIRCLITVSIFFFLFIKCFNEEQLDTYSYIIFYLNIFYFNILLRGNSLSYKELFE